MLTRDSLLLLAARHARISGWQKDRVFSHGMLSPFRVFTGKLSRRYIFLNGIVIHRPDFYASLVHFTRRERERKSAV